MTLVGVISDTHGQLRPEALVALAGVHAIIHAGDVGGRHVLEALAAIAPVHAVEGNVDVGGGLALPPRVHLSLGGVSIVVTHGHELGSPTPLGLVSRYDADVIVFGHTHRPLVERIGRQLVVNPGAAGPARFHLMPSVARLTIAGSDVQADLIALVERPIRR